jgi:hypothetical protein
MGKDCIWCQILKRERDKARAELAQSLTDEERLQIARLRTEIQRMQIAAERRNRDLDAMHLVWCDGGCESGVHRFDGKGPEAITQEVVDAAVRNTERLKRWWANRQGRMRDREAFPSP